MVVKVLLLFVCTILAFWISAICGGGASLVLVPILNFTLPVAVVPFALTLGTFSSSASRIVVFRKKIQWKIFFWFVPFSIPAVLLGAWLMKYINPLYLQLLVALFLVANLPELWRSKQNQTSREKPYPHFILAIVGFFAGFISGVTGAIGLLFNRFYLKYGLTKEEIVATRAANEIFLHTLKLGIYILLGLYSSHALWIGLTIAVASVISSYTVKFILPYVSEFTFRKLGYGAMVVSGAILLVNTSGSIIRRDKISFSTNRYDETTMNWRNSSFALEFSFGDGLEIERQITADELPPALQKEYAVLKMQYDQIFLEKVFRPGSKRTYEFYCYKKGQLTKLEFEETATGYEPVDPDPLP